MTFILVKISITAWLTVLISKIAKRCDELGGLIAALPLTTLFVITRMDFDGVSGAKIANHLTHTFFPSPNNTNVYPFPLASCFVWISYNIWGFYSNHIFVPLCLKCLLRVN
jgi:hypothetical protein